MKYTKPPLTFEKQADLLLERGMEGDRRQIIERLSVVNYYRLSGYWHPFRESADCDAFKPGTCFENIWRRYTFDRRLRLIVMDAVERIEVAVRTQLAYHHSHLDGNPFSFVENPSHLPELTSEDRARFLEDLKRDAQNSKETFAEHFRKKYGDSHSYMPVWMSCEVMTFGGMLTFYRGSSVEIQKKISYFFSVTEEVFNSWLLTLNVIRNICAHHGRLWNRELGVKPKIPRKDPRWHQPVEVTNHRIFSVLSICKFCLDKIAPQSQWPTRLKQMLSDYPEIPLGNMGFPTEWQNSPIWKEP